ncbi:spore germination protein KC [Oikeobacillus pervagus]|uniref:Spore germination protein KC n=1 Tax=Oikeobacillus pervagus TaxID=1325931 RepID=A0AAJ1WLB5_9BACI|nr:Ger(x)C family spore germination protein [Oikeobacillus pervagus]MDQ0216031.1 spore germination protein KC [Oikeobacillus pervagus]
MPKTTTIFLLLIVSLFLSGCWNRREFNELAITSGIGIDKVKNEYRVTAQVINPQAIANPKGLGVGSPFIVFEAKDKTIIKALRKLALNSPRKIYVAHLNILIIEEEVASEGIGEILDLFYRDQEIRSDFDVLVTKDHSAKDVLSTSTPFIPVPARGIQEKLIISNEFYDASKATTIRELISKSLASGVHPVVPSITSKKKRSDVPSASKEPPIPIGKLAVFHNDKLKGWLSNGEAQTYNTMTNNIGNSIVSFPCSKHGKGILESIKVKTTLSPHVNGDPEMNVHIFYKGRISELDCIQSVTTVEDIKALERKIEEYLTKFYDSEITKIQEMGVDIFGFGQEFHRKEPVEWDKMEKNWDDIFKKLKVNTKVDVHITNTGTIKNSLMKQLQGEK